MKKNKDPELQKKLKAVKALVHQVKDYSEYSGEGYIDLQITSKGLNRRYAREAIDHLLNEAEYVPSRQPLTVCVDFPDEDEIKDIQDVKRNLNDEIVKRIYQADLEIKNLNLICSMLFILGIVAMVASNLITGTTFWQSMTSQLLIITSWCFIWSTIEKFFFERRAFIVEWKKLKRLYFADYILDEEEIK